jgi:hypothetical protein
LIFSSIDRDLFWANLLDADPVALAAGLLMFFPIISGSVERWRWMLHDHADLPFRTGVKIFLAATSLNSVVPSKLGDLGKAVFLHNEGITDLERASNSVLLEKILDLAGLCTVFLFGFMVADVGDPVDASLRRSALSSWSTTETHASARVHPQIWVQLLPAIAVGFVSPDPPPPSQSYLMLRSPEMLISLTQSSEPDGSASSRQMSMPVMLGFPETSHCAPA